MKLWDKGIETNEAIDRFTVGKDRELDLLLAPLDIAGTIAHIIMLESKGLLPKEDLAILLPELRALYAMAVNGDFIIEAEMEDVHSQVEKLLTEKLGEAGKKIHTGRSRNDQVLLDIRLFARQELQKTVLEVKELFDKFVALSKKYAAVPLPGYTHTQIAMPSSFGLWFGAFAESLSDDMILLKAAWDITNQNPLGTGAGYGSSFPLDRDATTTMLGFENLCVNSVYAQSGRGKTEKTIAFALASVAGTLGKFADDACTFMNSNHQFISFPDELTTGSSIMPHKKNPDVLELIRARGNKLGALPNEILLITGNMQSGYHRDYQMIKENFLPAFSELSNCLKLTNIMLKGIRVNENILDDPKYEYLFTVEEVNNLVSNGLPFRDAYKKVGEAVQKGTYTSKNRFVHTHIGSTGNPGNEIIIQKMDNILERFSFSKAEDALKNLTEEK